LERSRLPRKLSKFKLKLMKNLNLLTAMLFGLALNLSAQSEKVYHTFTSTRIINSQSTETVKEGYLDIRITHRFGDFMRDWKPENSWGNLFGLEEASDVLVGFEYGIKNQCCRLDSRPTSRPSPTK
jgi:hypothetical protein